MGGPKECLRSDCLGKFRLLLRFRSWRLSGWFVWVGQMGASADVSCGLGGVFADESRSLGG